VTLLIMVVKLVLSLFYTCFIRKVLYDRNSAIVCIVHLIKLFYYQDFCS